MTDDTPKTVFIAVRDVPLSELIPFPGNAKRGDVAVILDSLRTHGQYRGVVVRHTPGDQFVILAGNHTAEAFRQHGPGPCTWTTRDESGNTLRCAVCRNTGWSGLVRSEIIACDDRTAQKINLVDNRSADTGTYDDEALDAILRSLEGDFAGTGYTPEDLMPSVPEPDEPVDVIQSQSGPSGSDAPVNGPQTGTQRSGLAQRGTLCDQCPCRDA